MLTRIAAALIALVALPHLASADEPGAVMRGPFKSAFEEVCAQATAKAKADGEPKIVCRREATLRSRPFERMEIHRVLISDEIADYYVSVKTARGWFVSAAPVEAVVADGHAGSADMLTSARARLHAPHPADGVSASFRFRYRLDCNMCEPRRMGIERWTVTSEVLCKPGSAGTPICLPEVSTSNR